MHDEQTPGQACPHPQDLPFMDALDRAYKAGENIALRQVARARDQGIGIGFCAGLATGIVIFVLFVEAITFAMRP